LQARKKCVSGTFDTNAGSGGGENGDSFYEKRLLRLAMCRLNANLFLFVTETFKRSFDVSGVLSDSGGF
jgi:hypothetical protein